jgi:hypothetical protein
MRPGRVLPYLKKMPKLTNWKSVFLAELAASPNVSRAARCAGVDQTTPYQAREVDPEFAAEWDSIKEASVEELQASAFKRAIESDTLTIFLLNSHMPSVYRDKQDVTLTVAKPTIDIPDVDPRTDAG